MGQRGPFLVVDALVAVERVVDAVTALWSSRRRSSSKRLRLWKVAMAIDKIAFLDDLVSRVSADRPPGKLFTGRPKNKSETFTSDDRSPPN